MQNQNPLDILEQKINQVLNLIDGLKNENQSLKQKNQEILSQLADKEQMIQRLREESAKNQTAITEIESYREKQDRIRTKVERLVEKLQEFDDVQ